MSIRDKIIRTVTESLESGVNSDIAECYVDIVSCGDCPYWHDCRNEYECFTYILNKLNDSVRK